MRGPRAGLPTRGIHPPSSRDLAPIPSKNSLDGAAITVTIGVIHQGGPGKGLRYC